MMDAIHSTALSAQRFTFESGKKTLHDDATNRILRIFAAIGDVSYFIFIVDAYPFALYEQNGWIGGVGSGAV
jgi:hypothetical protein